MLSFPFLFFQVPLLRTIFTHTKPTGFNRKGDCLPVDTDGLSALVDWLDEMLGRRLTRLNLSKSEMATLRAKLQEGRALLHQHPFHLKEHKRKRREIEAALEKVVKEDHPLFEGFFPNMKIMNEFKRNLADPRDVASKVRRGVASLCHQLRIPLPTARAALAPWNGLGRISPKGASEPRITDT